MSYTASNDAFRTKQGPPGRVGSIANEPQVAIVQATKSDEERIREIVREELANLLPKYIDDCIPKFVDALDPAIHRQMSHLEDAVRAMARKAIADIVPSLGITQ